MHLHWDPQNLLGVVFFPCLNGYFFVLSRSCLFVLSHFFYTLLFIGLCTLIFLHFQSLPQPPSSSPPTSNLTSKVPPWRPLVQWGGALHCISCILSTDYKAQHIIMPASMKYISWNYPGNVSFSGSLASFQKQMERNDGLWQPGTCSGVANRKAEW